MYNCFHPINSITLTQKRSFFEILQLQIKIIYRGKSKGLLDMLMPFILCSIRNLLWKESYLCFIICFFIAEGFYSYTIVIYIVQTQIPSYEYMYKFNSYQKSKIFIRMKIVYCKSRRFRRNCSRTCTVANLKKSLIKENYQNETYLFPS